MNSPGAAFQIGDVVAGKYRLERQLGIGGMGVVYAARHIHLNELVALKMVLPEGSDSHGARERFQREAQIAYKIRSEHVAKVQDLGFLDSGAPYMAMEFLHGHDLAAILAKNGVLPPQVAIDHVLQASEAIAEAHALGMVHRDLKPANLFLAQRPDGSPLVKVLDFGISKSPNAQMEARLTSTGALMGSPSYMSPEQIRDAKHVDHRCDVWALGMILYELLTNRVAFDATTVPGLLASIVADPPVPIERLRPDLPPALSAAIMRCLEKDLQRRMSSIGELAMSLGPFALASSQRSIERIVALGPPQRTIPAAISSKTAFDATHPSSPPARVVGPSGPSGPSGSTNNAAAWGNTVGDGQKRSSPLLSALIGGIVVIGLAGAGVGATVLVMRHRQPPAVAASTAPPAVLPAASSVAGTTASAEPSAVPTPSAAPVASVAPSATVAKKRPGKFVPQQENHDGLGGAIDSRK